MVHRFGEFRLDEHRSELRRAGEVVPLQPKVFDLLVYLIRARDRVVSKQELFEALWPDIVVSDAALTSAVRDARIALGDRDRPRWAIRTLPRRGYRFVAAVRPGAGDAESAPGGEVGSVFVGREVVLSRLDVALDAALGGHGRVALLVGEPGIGKSRCAEVFADRARARGVESYQASCQEPDGVPPYWPWMQLLRGILGAQAQSLPPALAVELSVLVPELRRSAPTPAPDPDPDPPRARLRLFEAVSGCLERAAGQRPLLLYLDDLHAADRSSLRLLQFVSRRIRRSPILLLASFRDGEPACSPLLTEVLGDLLRALPVARSDLSGLEVHAVESWVRRLGEDGSARRLAETLVHLTSGNPLFIEQLLLSRAGAARVGDPRSIAKLRPPPSLRDLVRERVHRLSDRCRIVVAAASALGRDADPVLLAEVTGLDRREVERSLDEARDAYLLRESDVGRLRFANPLIQEVVYAEQPPSARARWHGRAMAALGAAPGADPADPSALARHALASLPGDDAVQLARHAARAGRRAVEIRAYDEAETYFDRALQILARAPDAAPRERCELLLARGGAQSAAGHYHEGGRESFLRASSIARRHGWPDLFARAALGVGGLSHEIVTDDETLIELLEESLGMLGDDEDVLTARVTARLAAELQGGRSAARGRVLAERAVALSRHLADRACLGQALVARLFHLWVPDELAERRRTAREIVQIARTRDDPALELWGWSALMACALEGGSRSEWEGAVERYQRFARETRVQPHLDMTHATGILAAMVDGRLADADRRIGRVQAAPPSTASPLSGINVAIQLQWLRVLRGDPVPRADVEALSSSAIPADYATTARCIAAFLHAERGDAAEARALLADLGAGGFADLPRNMFWLLSLALLSRVCVSIGDLERAGQLEAMLRPFASHRVGLSFHYFGCVARHLGALAAARSAWDEAAELLEQAVASEDSLRASAFATLARADLGRVLLRRGRPGDRERALWLLRISRQQAAVMGMRGLEGELASLLRPAPLRRGVSPGGPGG